MTALLLPAFAIAVFACFVVLGVLTSRRLQHITALLLPLLLYLYTFHGYVLSLLASVGLVAADNPVYYAGAPYDVRIDEQFWLSIVMHGVFVNVFLLVLCAVAAESPPKASTTDLLERYRVAPLLGTAAVALFAGGTMWLGPLLSGLGSGQPIYQFFKGGGDLGVWYPVSRVFFDVAAMGLGGAVGLLLSQFRESRSRLPYFGLLTAATTLGGLLAITMGLLGDRATLLGGFVFGVVVATRHRVRLTHLVAVGVPAVFALGLIGWLREGRSLFDPNGFSTLLVGTAKGIMVTGEASVTFSMYAALRFSIPTSNGLSVLSWLEALVPHFIRPVRTLPDGFDYYSYAVGLPQHGWGLHFAADAYINFGVFGLVVGALALAAFYGSVIRAVRRNPQWNFALAGLLAGFPIGFRAGIPGLKTMAMGLITGAILGVLARERSIGAAGAGVPTDLPTPSAL
jgi:hypothetical protein